MAFSGAAHKAQRPSALRVSVHVPRFEGHRPCTPYTDERHWSVCEIFICLRSIVMLRTNIPVHGVRYRTEISRYFRAFAATVLSWGAAIPKLSSANKKRNLGLAV